MRLSEKIAIVTGGASGFGKGIVSKFVEEGAKVAIADVNYSLAQETANEINNTFPIKVDVSKTLDVEKMIKQTINEFGKVDI